MGRPAGLLVARSWRKHVHEAHKTDQLSSERHRHDHAAYLQSPAATATPARTANGII